MHRTLSVFALILFTAGCSEPWLGEGTVYEQRQFAASSPKETAPLSSMKHHNTVSVKDKPLAVPPVDDNTVRFRDNSGRSYTREEIAAMPEGSFVFYKKLGHCTTPNTAYAMHHMAGKKHCAALYQDPTPNPQNGHRPAFFRDWMGRGYAPEDERNRPDLWRRADRYDVFKNASVPESN